MLSSAHITGSIQSIKADLFKVMLKEENAIQKLCNETITSQVQIETGTEQDVLNVRLDTTKTLFCCADVTCECTWLVFRTLTGPSLPRDGAQAPGMAQMSTEIFPALTSGWKKISGPRNLS